MTARQKTIAVALVLVILAGAAALCSHVRSADTYLNRRPVTEKFMACSACGAKYPVTQAELMKIDLHGVLQDAEGNYLVPCAQCGKVAARLVVELKHEAAK